MIVHAHFQQKNGGDPTVEWQLARSGVVTASDFDCLISPLGKIRTGEGVETYMAKKLAETWQGGPLASFNSFSMEQGTILEETAIPFAAARFDLNIEQVGFITTDDGRVGCSPDGIIGFNCNWNKDKPTPWVAGLGESGGIEIKCPQLDTQIKYLLAGELPSQYIAQVQGSMFVTGCRTWHFMAFRRNLPCLHLVVERDERFCTNLKIALEEFLLKFDASMKRLCEINGGPPNPRNRGNVPFRMPQPENELLEIVP